MLECFIALKNPLRQMFIILRLKMNPNFGSYFLCSELTSTGSFMNMHLSRRDK